MMIGWIVILLCIGRSTAFVISRGWTQLPSISTCYRPSVFVDTSAPRKRAAHRTEASPRVPSAGVEVLAEPSTGTDVSSEPAVLLRNKTVVVARGKARLFWDGNPLVFGGSIAREEGNPAAGDVVDVVDSSEKFIGWGVYNPDSMYRVRVLAREGEPLANTRDVETLVRARLRTARDTRRAVGIPNADTNTYRLVNGEGDRLSGLVVDVFADVIGVSSSAVWVEVFRSEVEAALRQEFGAEATTIVWRRSDGRLHQDGWKGTGATTDTAGRGDSPVGLEGAAACATAGFEGNGERAGGAWDETVGGGGKKRGFRDDVPATVVRELGLEYEVRPQFGQKTGFYCDQRESREAVRKLSQGKTVLDMFCYSGGFALNAAVGGASRVLAVDSSQPALEEARINAGRNGLDRVKFVNDDALAFMKAAATTGDRFGVVVLDPPKLAPSKKSVANATSRYRRLNAAAIKLVQPGGILVTFTCSAAMTQSGTFVGTVQSAAAAAGRTLTLLRTVGPAVDHVTNPCYPEGVYLTGAFFYVS